MLSIFVQHEIPNALILSSIALEMTHDSQTYKLYYNRIIVM